ncbi:NADH-quinone oxidoreductase subunit G [Gleimia hominis]|uniref:NADH-quinone oxidoreductase subunit G n=1 Tax=Gleimia hominis TaxID=595468 RepID=UPI000C8029EF|nr:NADH-quinone oxidoreductase subunit G [Gleimia hominis]WIK64543.1 NADH-quinone oxidoreductase subunit G [Gleimia hominis]
MSEAQEMVTLTIDGAEVSVPKGTLIIRAAEQAGIRIPRFCDHPLLKPAGACRQCLVEVAAPGRDGKISTMPKPQTSCTMTVMPGMQVKTQRTSEVAKKAQHGIMEFLLINHPLDCPVCDKGGECPLQNQAMTEGREATRFIDAKRTFPKPVRVTSNILLDRDRCILCQRCVRFGKEIAGDAFIDLQGRGGGSSPTDDHYFMGEQVGGFDTQILGYHNEAITDGVLPPDLSVSGPEGDAGVEAGSGAGPLTQAQRDQSDRPFGSYFSGNIIQICPVGALTAASYRFRGRPFDLVSTPSITEHDASGSAIRVDIRRGEIVRRLAGNDPEVNEEWITDKDRFAFEWSTGSDRLQSPLVREDGKLVPTSWGDALHRVASALKDAKAGNNVLLPGGRLTVEDAYAWSKFARVAVGTNQIDQRMRNTSLEETQFLGARVAGRGLDVTYKDLEKAGRVLLVALEPEDEIGSVFLRLRKGVLAGKTQVTTVAPMTTPGSRKLAANVLRAAPGTEPEVIAAIDGELADQLASGIILVGERAATVPGLYTQVAKLAQRTGARLAWIPRRAGERGGLDVGLVGGLLPFGRSVEDPEARADLSAVWGTSVPDDTAKCAEGIVADAAQDARDVIVLGGVDPRDAADPQALRTAVQKAKFVVSLEVRQSELTEMADVVLPVAPAPEKNGTYINWEGRLRPFGQVLSSRALTDREVLSRIAEDMGIDLGIATLKATHAEMNELMNWDRNRMSDPDVQADPVAAPAANEAVLATHKPMLDSGRMQDNAPTLAGTGRKPVAYLSAQSAQSVGVTVDEPVTVGSERGTITLPVAIADLPQNVVWVPECSEGSVVHENLGARAGSVVSLVKAEVK